LTNSVISRFLVLDAALGRHDQARPERRDKLPGSVSAIHWLFCFMQTSLCGMNCAEELRRTVSTHRPNLFQSLLFSQHNHHYSDTKRTEHNRTLTNNYPNLFGNCFNYEQDEDEALHHSCHSLFKNELSLCKVESIVRHLKGKNGDFCITLSILRLRWIVAVSANAVRAEHGRPERASRDDGAARNSRVCGGAAALRDDAEQDEVSAESLEHCRIG
jgi:hypothetical protein